MPAAPNLAALSASVPSAAAANGAGRQVRVSLTGEVFEDIPAGPVTPSSYAGGPAVAPPPPAVSPVQASPLPPPLHQAPVTPPLPRPTVPMRKRGYSRLSTAVQEKKPKRTSGGFVPLVVILLLLGFGLGGWAWYQVNGDNPEKAALEAYQDFNNEDWRALQSRLQLSAEAKKQMPSGDAFAQKLQEKNPLLKAQFDQMKGKFSDIRAGKPIIHGDKADVPTSATLTYGARKITVHGTAHMIKVGGKWKLDSGSESLVQAAMDIIGRPAAPDTTGSSSVPAPSGGQ